MINPNYTIKEIERRFLKYLTEQFGEIQVIEHLSPITGGNEAYLYRFQVTGIDELDKPLVLRLFPEYYGSEHSTAEWIINNLLADQGLPVPRVHIKSNDMKILGGSFLVMDFIEGEAINPSDDISVLFIAAQTQARLHTIDATPIKERLQAQGVDPYRFTLKSRVDRILEKAERYPQMVEVTDWIAQNLPEEPEKPSIIHGDFHPLNLLIKDGRVTGILDWINFMIGDPMVDLGFSYSLHSATSRHIVPREDFNRLIDIYFSEYEKIRPIDHTNLEYYRAFRIVMALYEGLEGQAFWAQPEIKNNLIVELKEFTQISINV